MSCEFLLLEVADAVATITINRPQAMNALSPAVLDELEQTLETLERDDTVAVLILTGAGEKAFVAGGDIAGMAGYTPSQARTFALRAQRLLNRIEQGPKPVLAAVNGYALGGGCELAMACDLRIASESAWFGQPEVNLGIPPGWGGTQRLPRLVGRGRALELLLTGERISAAEAWRIGLVNRVVPPGELLDTTRQLAARIAAKSRPAVRACRDALREGLEMEVVRGSRYEAELFALCFADPDQREGMGAFLEKRPPRFTSP